MKYINRLSVLFIAIFVMILSVSIVSASISYDLSNAMFQDASIYCFKDNKLEKNYIDLIELNDNWDKLGYDAIFLDLDDTSGFDYVIIKPNDNIMVEEIGTLQGLVVDSLGNVVPNAEMSFDCLGGYNYNNITETDRFGSFTAHLPIGSCRVITKYQDRVGIVDLEINPGDLQRIEMKLDLKQYVKEDKNSKIILYLILLIFVVLIIALLVFRLDKIKKEIKANNNVEEVRIEDVTGKNKKEDDFNNHKALESIIKTLNYREQEIVKALQEKGVLNQSDLRSITGLPKSTLSRILKKLYLKNIIDIVEHGNIKKISLRNDFQ